MQYPIIRILIVLACAAGGVAVIVKLVKKFILGAAAVSAATSSSEVSSSSGSGGTSTIFINGGTPLSGNTMGKITVDGQSLTVRYTDLPLEIAIPTGRHHIIVEGGVHGDARIDRFMDFGALDVWTVDLPGGNDADVIRHQMIGFSEYRRALSNSGFNVTRKQL
ncbi:MAG: hypothetical protein IJZ56_06955 [Oscillospiraceae bacterium]|nr:hypothetical protein [Oscillospiraceae bacterium]